MNSKAKTQNLNKNEGLEYVLFIAIIIPFVNIVLFYLGIMLIKQELLLSILSIVFLVLAGVFVASRSVKYILLHSALTGVLAGFFFPPLISSFAVLSGIANAMPPAAELAVGIPINMVNMLIPTLLGGIIYKVTKYFIKKKHST